MDGKEVWVDLREVIQEIAITREIYSDVKGIAVLDGLEARIKQLAHNSDFEAHLNTSA